jgi:hypothetical protein
MERSIARGLLLGVCDEQSPENHFLKRFALDASPRLCSSGLHPGCHSAPAHQMKQYYVYGEIDPCQIEWDDLMLCMKTKLKKAEESEV